MTFLAPFLLTAAVLAAPADTTVLPTDTAPVVRRGGLGTTFARLKQRQSDAAQRRQPFVIAYLGGSITAGAGASDAGATSYRALVTRWFRETFPQAEVREVNAAIGGTPSELGAFRVGRDVLAKRPDLVFVEFAVNDGGLPDASVNRAMEGIVRQIRRDNPRTDICFLYTLAREHLADFAANRLPRTMRLHEAVAEHYKIPSVNLALAVARKINGGVMTWDAFSKDTVHPTDAGYQVYADVITAWLGREMDPEYTGAHPSGRAARLPAPLFPDNYENAAMIDVCDAPLSAGWRREDKKWVGQFDHVAVADAPGATLALDFTGGMAGIFIVLGPDTGAFEYRIDGGVWKKCDPFDQWAKDYYRPSSRTLEDNLTPGKHRLEIRTLAEHHADSKGSVTRLGYFLTDGKTK